MVPVRKTIELREGVTAEVLVTPALYGVASRKGFDIRATGEDKLSIMEGYIKLLYCAAINAWEVRAFDDPDIGDFPYKFADFNDWAWANPKESAAAISFAFTALTGKTMKEAAEEEEVKKKSRKK